MFSFLPVQLIPVVQCRVISYFQDIHSDDNDDVDGDDDDDDVDERDDYKVISFGATSLLWSFGSVGAH